MSTPRRSPALAGVAGRLSKQALENNWQNFGRRRHHPPCMRRYVEQLSGIRAMVASAFLFSVMAALIKVAARTIPAAEIVFLRNVVHVFVFVPIWLRTTDRTLGNKRLLLLRGLLGLCALEAYAWTLAVMPLADAWILQAMNPVFVALLAPWILREKGSGLGWVTAEYAMLPRATLERSGRERNGPGGRSQEIQRLIGRSLRAAVGRWDFGEYTVKIDCDVLQADGGTRTASITGACVALVDAFQWLADRTKQPSPFGQLVAAVSVGLVGNEVMLDLAYTEDKDAEVDANIVMRAPNDFVEVQGTGENGTFTRPQFDAILTSAERGIASLFAAQKKALGW